jgi:hypothetical protein
MVIGVRTPFVPAGRADNHSRLLDRHLHESKVHAFIAVPETLSALAD